MDFISRLAEMIDGPAALRFVVQPLIGLWLGVQAGQLDARRGREPFLVRLFTSSARGLVVRDGTRQVLVPVVVAFVLDVIVSALLFRQIFLLSSLVVGCVLVGLPYVVGRGLTNRWCQLRQLRGSTPRLEAA